MVQEKGGREGMRTWGESHEQLTFIINKLIEQKTSVRVPKHVVSTKDVWEDRREIMKELCGEFENSIRKDETESSKPLQMTFGKPQNIHMQAV